MNDNTITYNVNRICRFCLSEDGVMSTIFDEEIHGGSIPLTHKIITCVSVQIAAEDGLPSLICHRCLYQMERSYEFKVQCENSDATLRQYVTRIKDEHDQSREDDSEKEESKCVESMVVNVDPSEVEVENRTIVLTDNAEGDQVPSIIEIKLPPSVDISPLDIKQEPAVSNSPRPIGHAIGLEALRCLSRPHVCSICGKAFAQRRELNRHHMVHSGEKPFACPVCSKKFARRDKVVSHLRIHGRQNSYNCFQCPAMFICREELKRHEMDHLGKQPWQCQKCGQTFCSKADLVKHRRTHREDTVYRCHLCSVIYTQQENLLRHLKLHAESKLPRNPNQSELYNSDQYVDGSSQEVSMFMSKLGQNSEIMMLPAAQ